MTLEKQLTGFTEFSKGASLVFTGVYSEQEKMHRYLIESSKEEADQEDTNTAERNQEEHQGLKKTIELLSNIQDQFDESNTKSSLVQILQDSNTKIVLIYFSAVKDIDDDEIDLMFAKHKDQIAEADIIWIIDVHIKPNSREFLVKYTNHKYEQMNFMSKNYIQSMSLETEDTQSPLSYPCIDPFIKEFCKNIKDVDSFYNELKYSVGFAGYTISLESI